MLFATFEIKLANGMHAVWEFSNTAKVANVMHAVCQNSADVTVIKKLRVYRIGCGLYILDHIA